MKGYIWCLRSFLSFFQPQTAVSTAYISVAFQDWKAVVRPRQYDSFGYLIFWKLKLWNIFQLLRSDLGVSLPQTLFWNMLVADFSFQDLGGSEIFE
jgi:hypothetical protein